MLGLAMFFSGAALVTYIVAGVSLRLSLALTALFPVIGFSMAWRRLSPEGRARLVLQLRIGVLAGLVATVAYDASKYFLSRWDPSPYNPFEVVRIFGILLVGASAQSFVVYTAGITFHFLNGVCFAVAYLFLLGQFGIPAAIVWGLFLEIFQLTLYPGWLNISFYREFFQISVLSHLIYGLTLGLCCRSLGKRTLPSEELPS